VEIKNKTKKGHLNEENLILVDDIILPEGLEVTLDEILNIKNSDMITVDKDNLLQSGVIEYLLAIKNGETKVRVLRSNRLQKINIVLASAA